MISILSQRFLKYSFRNLLKFRNRFFPTANRQELYFAYGANLSSVRLEKNHLNFNIIGAANAVDYQIEFSMPCEYKGKGYASLRYQGKAETWGILIEVDSLSLAMLDILEWVPFGAYHREKIGILSGSKSLKAWAYIADNPVQGLKAPKKYRDAIVRESKRLKFPQPYIDKVLSYEVSDTFELDPGFSLLIQRKRRLFEKQLESLYLCHDRIREKLAEKLP